MTRGCKSLLVRSAVVILMFLGFTITASHAIPAVVFGTLGLLARASSPTHKR